MLTPEEMDMQAEVGVPELKTWDLLISTKGAVLARNTSSGWWFGTCFIFPYIGNDSPK